MATNNVINSIDIPKSTISEKGDIIVGTALSTPSKLPVGVDGYLIVANSASTPGLKWDSPANIGIVTGGVSATDNAIARYDGASGKLIQNSMVTVDDSGNLSCLKVETSTTGTHRAKFGSTNPLYVEYSASNPTFGFNTYFDDGVGAWKFGAGSTSQYGGLMIYIPANGSFNFYTTTSVGNSEASASISPVMTIAQNGEFNTYGGGAIKENGVTVMKAPSSATDNAIARYDGAGGKLLQDSLATVNDSGHISGTLLKATGNVTQGQFGTTVPVYIQHSTSTSTDIAFNLNYNVLTPAWNFGEGSSSQYGGKFSYNPSAGSLVFSSSDATGNAGGTATIVDLFTISRTGKLGLACNPAYGLDVESYTNKTYAKFGAVNNCFYIVSNNSPWLGFNLYNDSSASAWKYGKGSSGQYGGIFGFATTVGRFRWFSAPIGNADETATITEIMTLYPEGKLGIGTATPDNCLDVESAEATTYTALELTNTATSTQRWTVFANSNTSNYGPSKGFGIRDVTNTTTRFCINTSGNIGIGTISPDYALQVNGTIAPETDAQDLGVSGSLRWNAFLSSLAHQGTTLGFFNTAVTTKQTVTGSRGGNTALASLLTALANYGLIVNSSTA